MRVPPPELVRPRHGPGSECNRTPVPVFGPAVFACPFLGRQACQATPRQHDRYSATAAHGKRNVYRVCAGRLHRRFGRKAL